MKPRRPIPSTGQDPEDAPLVFKQLPLLAIFFLLLLAWWVLGPVGKQDRVWDLPLRAPFVAQEPAAAPGYPPLVIQIDPDGAVSINEIVMETSDSKDLPKLRNYLQKLRSHIDSSNPVFILPSAETRFQRIAEVLSAVIGTGIENYSLLEEWEKDRIKARTP